MRSGGENTSLEGRRPPFHQCTSFPSPCCGSVSPSALLCLESKGFGNDGLGTGDRDGKDEAPACVHCLMKEIGLLQITEENEILVSVSRRNPERAVGIFNSA